MEELNYHINEYKKYGVQVVRYMTIYVDNSGEPYTTSHDFSYLQYLRSDNLETFTELCKQLFEEFQIVEYKDPKDTWHDTIVYTTPLLAKYLEIDKALKEKRDEVTEKLKAKNREWLATVPKCQVLYKFSAGTRPYLVLVHNEYNDSRRGGLVVSANLVFSETPDPDCSTSVNNKQWVRVYEYEYISKNGRLLKKKFSSRYKGYGYPIEELEVVASKLLEYRDQVKKLSDLLI